MVISASVAREFNTDLRSASGNGSASNRGQNLDGPADRIVIVHPARHDDRGWPVIGPRGLGNFWIEPARWHRRVKAQDQKIIAFGGFVRNRLFGI